MMVFLVFGKFGKCTSLTFLGFYLGSGSAMFGVGRGRGRGGWRVKGGGMCFGVSFFCFF